MSVTKKRPAKATGEDTAPKSKKRKPPLRLTRQTMIDLYAAHQFLPLAVQKETGLRMPVKVYFKDPFVARQHSDIGIDDDFTTPWEPGLRDGPTSSRFTVVDYNSTTNTLTEPAVWNKRKNCYLAPDGTPLDRNAIERFQFHQLSVWAIVQNTLDYFESGFGLGRRISWAFDGNRLIVLPHAGYGENAFYDRTSKSLQFYYFNNQNNNIVYTCLSSDIVNHEFGHAVLDGVRPHFYESVTGEGAAFHEFLGDLTAILMAFRNNAFRRHVLEQSHGNLATDTLLANLAPEFGQAVTGDQSYLRSALNKKTMKDLAGNFEPHDLSEVLTGAMFDILRAVFIRQQDVAQRDYKAGVRKRKPSDAETLFATVTRMQTMAIQPLDLLPPCSVTFRDYALAVLRTEQVANPTDPNGYRAMMIDIFVNRGILNAKDKRELLKPIPVFTRPSLDVAHSIESIAASRGGAYRFLDDNRAKFLIPPNADFEVSEVIRARKLALDGRLLPDQIIVQYTWREDVPLKGKRFGHFDGETTTMLCGATLVLDENGNQIHWSRQPGSVSLTERAMGKPNPAQTTEQQEGTRRRTEFLQAIAARIEAGVIGEAVGGELGMVERALAPFGVRRVDGMLRFELSPHFSLDNNSCHTDTGDRQWQISF